MKIKSNDRMPARSRANVAAFEAQARACGRRASDFLDEHGPQVVFEILHSMRRWYSGQTMARALLARRDVLEHVMDLDPESVRGVFRGFKVDKGSPLAALAVGEEFDLTVTRNHGFSSWSTRLNLVNRFSGGGKGKVGLIVQLAHLPSPGVPVLAPPAKTARWFNRLYEETIGSSFRPTENEYLIFGEQIAVEVRRVKR